MPYVELYPDQPKDLKTQIIEARGTLFSLSQKKFDPPVHPHDLRLAEEVGELFEGIISSIFESNKINLWNSKRGLTSPRGKRLPQQEERFTPEEIADEIRLVQEEGHAPKLYKQSLAYPELDKTLSAIKENALKLSFQGAIEHIDNVLGIIEGAFPPIGINNTQQQILGRTPDHP